MFKDCQGNPYPVYAEGLVVSCNVVKEAVPANSVYELKVKICDRADGDDGHPGASIPTKRSDFSSQASNSLQEPAAGQFYMLHAVRSDVLLGRPISVFDSKKNEDGSLTITFLILVKGKGTVELTSLREGDKINLLGPCGNRFPLPDFVTGEGKTSFDGLENGVGGVVNLQKVCIVGGGIGVAPVAGFASTLPDFSYDFYASFKSGSYGLQNLKANKLVITTDDGSVGVHGMLPVALTAQALKEGNYSALYACGPTPMLAYLQKVCEEVGLKCWLSMEARMACGVGVCLGCVIDTTKGKLRCCKEGPVFDGSILKFEKVDQVAGIKVQPRREPLSSEPDLSVNIAGVKFQNPVIGSSGTFGFGTEYATVFDVNRLGGISSKGLTLEARQGNDGIRLHEFTGGLMNSIGLQNPGIKHFIENELPQMMSLKPVAIANLSGSSLETYVEGAKLLEKSPVPMVELNISCPNVKAGGAAWGMSCSAAQQVVGAVRKEITKPLVVKLTPQAKDLNDVALACIEAGADGISLCNSFQGIAVDIERGVPVFNNLKAGVGGPAVRPIAVRLIYELVEAINTLPEEKRVPVIAIGGIASWQDAVEFIMAGASALQVGTMTFANPYAMVEIIEGLAAFMKRKGYKTIEEMRGIIQKK